MLDAEGTGDFNACVEGGRFREDVNVSPDLLLYGQGVFAYSLTEQPNGRCDAARAARSPPAGIPAASVQDVVWDGVAGVEYSFDDQLSHVFASVGARDDTREDGDFQYREQHVEYSVAKYLGGPWSLEVQGRHRHRKEQDLNLDPTTYAQAWWYEGENYVALRMAPKWVFTQGFEYTTLVGQPTHVCQRRGALQVHEQLERARLRRRAARRVPVRERALPLLPGVRGGAGRADAEVLEQIGKRVHLSGPPRDAFTVRRRSAPQSCARRGEPRAGRARP